jgi:hypothetical protein
MTALAPAPHGMGPSFGTIAVVSRDALLGERRIAPPAPSAPEPAVGWHAVGARFIARSSLSA